MSEARRPTFDEILQNAPAGELFGGVDLAQLEYNLSLTPLQRIQKHYAARMLVARLREATKERHEPRAVSHSPEETE